MICDHCHKDFPKLLELHINNEEYQALCPNCWGWNDARADIEYERQKEEGLI